MNLSLQSVDGSLNILNQSAPWQQNAFITVITSSKQTEDVLYMCRWSFLSVKLRVFVDCSHLWKKNGVKCVNISNTESTGLFTYQRNI